MLLRHDLMGHSQLRKSISAVLLAAACGCGSSSEGDPAPPRRMRPPPEGVDNPQPAPDPDPDMPAPLGPGDVVLTGITGGSPASRARLAELAGEVARLRGASAAQLASEYPVRHAASLGYSPGQAEFLDRIQASALALNAAELAVLEDTGFVVSARQQFPNFFRGYAAIYMEDLPVYVSADALLDALHRSYDQILISIEASVLIPALDALLSRLSQRIGSLEASDGTKADLDLYLDVARGLLATSAYTPRSDAARALIEKSKAAEGFDEVSLFGLPRLEDFSQYKPRGHYLDSPLSEYFRAMMWLGRVDFRLIETLPDGDLVFRRQQYEAMLGLHQLMDERSAELWNDIDGVVRAFVGESDSMTYPEVRSLLADLGGLAAARQASDEAVVRAINDGGYGEQQIASHLRVNDGTQPSIPLNRSFLLFGQRYVADSHVFSETVYDRIPRRMMPNPLDAAFAAFGNNQALALSGAELEQYPELSGALGAMRFSIDSHGASFWDANLYNLWSSALRSLSPAPDMSDPAGLGLPAVAGTEAWGRRVLNTQLGSWAQLRHDTLLYAKQSYTDIPACEFPDAYVEPNPEFFRALVRFAERGSALVDGLPAGQYLAEDIRGYFANLAASAGTLAQMAEQQKSGTPFSAAQLAFINDAVRVVQDTAGCTTVETPDGWYADLFYNQSKAIEQDLTIADVHTQPADEVGNIVGRVLHVGTGFPRLMTITVDTCVGPRAYAGMAYAYHELITNDFQRLNDEEWTGRVTSAPPADAPWAAPFIAR